MPATDDYVEKLKPGGAVAAIGFPIEGMTATMVVNDAPATLHFGNISSLTDMFMCRAKDADDQLLIQHTVPVTGGMSGSPLIDKSGDVIGIISGGNTASVVKEVTVNKKPSDKVNVEINEIASRAPLWSISRSKSICSKACKAERPIGKLPTIGAIGSRPPRDT